MNAIDEIYQTIKLLLESEITAYQIEKKTGVSRAKIGRLKDGKNELSNLSLGTTEKLYEYAKAHLNE
ncbi:MAG: trp operon repressor [Staphylococcus equorum]|nr:trp operon repressor [Staphylococcus equorum]